MAFALWKQRQVFSTIIFCDTIDAILDTISYERKFLMEFLYFLEGLRTPVLDTFFSIITHCSK